MKNISEILGTTLPSDLVEALQESFDNKLAEATAEARKEIEVEVEANLARRFERDRDTIINSIDSMVTDALTAQEESRNAEMEQFTEARVAYHTAMVEGKKMLASRMRGSLAKAAEIMEGRLAEEISKLHADRASFVDRVASMNADLQEAKQKIAEQHEEHVRRIDAFVTEAVRNEIVEFAQDKKALVEQRVKLATESRKKLKETQDRFIAEAAAKVEKFVEKNLQSHFSELHEDIEYARQNEFGRRIFNAIAAEYMTSYFAEGTEVRSLQNMLEAKEAEITEAQALVADAERKLNEANEASNASVRKARLAEDRAERTKIMSELLANLKGEKRAVMENLLGTTKTVELRKAFNKLLPVVLSETRSKSVETPVLSESKETPQRSSRTVTGDAVRSNRLLESANDQNEAENAEIALIKHLAGLK